MERWRDGEMKRWRRKQTATTEIRSIGIRLFSTEEFPKLFGFVVLFNDGERDGLTRGTGDTTKHGEGALSGLDGRSGAIPDHEFVSGEDSKGVARVEKTDIKRDLNDTGSEFIVAMNLIHRCGSGLRVALFTEQDDHPLLVDETELSRLFELNDTLLVWFTSSSLSDDRNNVLDEKGGSATILFARMSALPKVDLISKRILLVVAIENDVTVLRIKDAIDRIGFRLESAIVNDPRFDRSRSIVQKFLLGTHRGVQLDHVDLIVRLTQRLDSSKHDASSARHLLLVASR